MLIGKTLLLLIDIDQSIICVCFNHGFDIFRFIMFLGYIYKIEILWHDIELSIKLSLLIDKKNCLFVNLLKYVLMLIIIMKFWT